MPWTSEIIYILTMLGSVPFLSSGGRLPEDRLTGTGPLKATVLFLALDHAKLNPLGLEHPSIQLNPQIQRLDLVSDIRPSCNQGMKRLKIHETLRLLIDDEVTVVISPVHQKLHPGCDFE